MENKKKGIVITAIICLTLLELVALAMGFNGTLFTIIVAAIAGLAGYNIKGKIERGKNGK